MFAFWSPLQIRSGDQSVPTQCETDIEKLRQEENWDFLTLLAECANIAEGGSTSCSGACADNYARLWPCLEPFVSVRQDGDILSLRRINASCSTRDAPAPKLEVAQPLCDACIPSCRGLSERDR